MIENLILTLLVAVLGIMQNPDVPLEQKQQIYQQILPVISIYMEENKIESERVGEIGVGASIEVETGVEEATTTPEKIDFIVPIIPNLRPKK